MAFYLLQGPSGQSTKLVKGHWKREEDVCWRFLGYHGKVRGKGEGIGQGLFIQGADIELVWTEDERRE